MKYQHFICDEVEKKCDFNLLKIHKLLHFMLEHIFLLLLSRMHKNLNVLVHDWVEPCMYILSIVIICKLPLCVFQYVTATATVRVITRVSAHSHVVITLKALTVNIVHTNSMAHPSMEACVDVSDTLNFDCCNSITLCWKLLPHWKEMELWNLNFFRQSKKIM